jgi:hypothetical protein
VTSAASGPPKPVRQLELFAQFYGNREEQSNAVPMWDSVPKYAISRRQQTRMRDEKGGLPVLTVETVISRSDPGRPKERIGCRVKLTPATVEVEPGVFRQFYPAATEELVEIVLRKLLADAEQGEHDPNQRRSWVSFSLSQIRTELAERGHTRSLTEIKQALEIMNGCRLDIETEARGKRVALSAPILPVIGKVTRDEFEEDRSARWSAQMHALVSAAINVIDYRQFDYALHMGLKTQIARYLHMRIAMNYRNAGVGTDYNLRLSTIARDSQLLHRKRLLDNLKTVEEALDELKDTGVLYGYAVRKERKGRRIVDAVFEMQASMDQISYTKATNKRILEGREVLRAENLLGT